MSYSTLVILSGGLDSTVLLSDILSDAKNEEVRAISFNYSQRHHSRELKAAMDIAAYYNVPHEILPIPLGAWGALSGGEELPLGHYEDENMRKTVVPYRNLSMIAVAASRAVAQGMSRIAIGAHGGDHAVYPDCRAQFLSHVDGTLALGDWYPVKLFYPYATLSKADIVSIGARLRAPMDKTWSCYAGRTLHCGKCGTCVERREAFILANIQDPTTYES